MVCLDVDQRLAKSEVGVSFRPSMNKFPAKKFRIDVVRTSSVPSFTFLNRQIILLLSSLGIRDEVFLSLQERMLQKSRDLDPDPGKACNALKELKEFGGNGYHAFLLEYLQTVDGHQEPFTQRLLHSLQGFLIKELRTKARILVPHSWALFGVVDETSTLNYGQVFVQIDNSHRQDGVKGVLRGPVVVTRNPCFHPGQFLSRNSKTGLIFQLPGDIRRLEAVDVPELRALTNVVVFPMNGPRPHAMEMSGGDLDGDTFWICINPKLIFDVNEEPFDYQDQAAQAEGEAQRTGNKPYTIEDVCEFFGEYIEADK
jgi:RNA-dependent RNA polymerase